MWHKRCDDGLAPGQHSALKKHLAICAECRSYHRQMDELQAALTILRESSQAACSALETEVSPATASNAERPWRAQARQVFKAAAALAVLVAGGFYLASLEPTIEPDGKNGTAARIAVNDAAHETQPVPARLVLLDGSADEYIAVARQVSQPNVHLFALYHAVN